MQDDEERKYVEELTNVLDGEVDRILVRRLVSKIIQIGDGVAFGFSIANTKTAAFILSVTVREDFSILRLMSYLHLEKSVFAVNLSTSQKNVREPSAVVLSISVLYDNSEQVAPSRLVPQVREVNLEERKLMAAVGSMPRADQKNIEDVMRIVISQFGEAVSWFLSQTDTKLCLGVNSISSGDPFVFYYIKKTVPSVDDILFTWNEDGGIGLAVILIKGVDDADLAGIGSGASDTHTDNNNNNNNGAQNAVMEKRQLAMMSVQNKLIKKQQMQQQKSNRSGAASAAAAARNKNTGSSWLSALLK